MANRFDHTKYYREKCLKQKLPVCNVCGASDGRLIVHHINGDDTDHRLENLIPLCDSCHRKTHSHKPHNPVLDNLTDQLPESSLPRIKDKSRRWSNRT